MKKEILQLIEILDSKIHEFDNPQKVDETITTLGVLRSRIEVNFPEGLPVANAVNTLTKALREDEDFYYGYQSNIAMAFVDTCVNEGSKMDTTALHDLANKAAKRFLDLWIENAKK